MDILNFLILSVAVYLQLHTASADTATAEVSTVYEFPESTWIENIAVRANGNLVVVLFDRPEVHEIDPFATPPTARLVAEFDGKQGVQGVVETTEDVFAIIPFTDTLSYSLWTVDLTSPTPKQNEIIPQIQGVGVLNGLTKLSNNTLLASDTLLGTVTQFDVEAKTATPLKDDSMSGATFQPGLGINGVRLRGNLLYFTNSFQQSLNRVVVDEMTGDVTGPVQVITSAIGLLPDDLAIGNQDGQPSYVMQLLKGEVLRVSDSGEIEDLGIQVSFPTSAQFGRSEDDTNILYVSSGGSLLSLIGLGLPGRVYAVKVA